MATHLDALKSGLQVCYGIVFLALIIWVFPDLRAASKMLLERASTAASFKFSGLEIAFSATSVAQGLELAKVPEDEQAIVLAAVQNLGSDGFRRLMAVGQLENLCEFERPTPQMRSDVALDYELAAKGLTEIEPSWNTLESVKAWRTSVLAKGRDVEIGAPHQCYKMTLSKVGNRVKTVIVENLAPAFHALIPTDKKLVAMR
jgi:hypothetical protein